MRVDLLRRLVLLCLLSVFTVGAVAGGMKCRPLGGNTSNYTVYESGRCPVGMLNIGPVEDSGGRKRLGFSDGFLNSLGNAGKNYQLRQENYELKQQLLKQQPNPAWERCTNYWLDKMIDKSVSYDEGLKEAAKC